MMTSAAEIKIFIFLKKIIRLFFCIKKFLKTITSIENTYPIKRY